MAQTDLILRAQNKASSNHSVSKVAVGPDTQLWSHRSSKATAHRAGASPEQKALGRARAG